MCFGSVFSGHTESLLAQLIHNRKLCLNAHQAFFKHGQSILSVLTLRLGLHKWMHSCLLRDIFFGLETCLVT